jgi:hypothetical protein
MLGNLSKNTNYLNSENFRIIIFLMISKMSEANHYYYTLNITFPVMTSMPLIFKDK